MTLKSLVTLATIVLISGCSILGPKEIEVVSKPVQLEIIQPTLPREVSLNTPRWYVVSEARIANPCKKVEGETKRPKACDLEDRENPDWPEGYTYLDRFLDEMKAQNNGDVVFVATTIGDYKQMTVNNQEIRRYIRELGEVVVYSRNVTMPNADKAVGVEIEKKN